MYVSQAYTAKDQSINRLSKYVRSVLEMQKVQLFYTFTVTQPDTGEFINACITEQSTDYCEL